ncbi:hypothetical protein SKAU_G00157970 [Synaphobranchus kaupii]|uniref:Uncharacterized protein n=1 Tax=Synaphobranchus kaupii TaxID=118154 RepID=A0A9Q1FHX7_SYNKA|nr:hypothetical protein SKAU_G00157970 [Synaphobranchus kaupii]
MRWAPVTLGQANRMEPAASFGTQPLTRERRAPSQGGALLRHAKRNSERVRRGHRARLSLDVFHVSAFHFLSPAAEVDAPASHRLAHGATGRPAASEQAAGIHLTPICQRIAALNTIPRSLSLDSASQPGTSAMDGTLGERPSSLCLEPALANRQDLLF